MAHSAGGGASFLPTGNTIVDEYRKTFTPFSRSDIIATFDGKVIGELQQISYSVTREKALVYTMGSPTPRSFSRGKRGVAGTLIFAVFNRDALLETLRDAYAGSLGYTAAGNELGISLSQEGARDQQVRNLILQAASMQDWNAATEAALYAETETPGFVQMSRVQHLDQLPPFTIGINFANEYGQLAHLEIYGVEILNSGTGMSIDDIVTEQAVSFIARDVTPITPGPMNVGRAR